MVGLNRAAAERGDARPTGTSDQVVDAVLHYINEHYSEALTLDQLSEKFFISKYHLLRKFDAQVGTTVHRYILQKRLLNAKQLLAGGVPPNEVCQYCGFGDRRLKDERQPPGRLFFLLAAKERTKENCRCFDAADPRLGGCTPPRPPKRKSEVAGAKRTQYYFSFLTPPPLPPP